jgi:hypothetical protein
MTREDIGRLDCAGPPRAFQVVTMPFHTERLCCIWKSARPSEGWRHGSYLAVDRRYVTANCGGCDDDRDTRTAFGHWLRSAGTAAFVVTSRSAHAEQVGQSPPKFHLRPPRRRRMRRSINRFKRTRNACWRTAKESSGSTRSVRGLLGRQVAAPRSHRGRENRRCRARRQP